MTKARALQLGKSLAVRHLRNRPRRKERLMIGKCDNVEPKGRAMERCEG